MPATTHRSLGGALVGEHLAVLRSVSTATGDFRRAVARLSTLVLSAALDDLDGTVGEVTSPVGPAATLRAGRITVVPVLRAGLGMLEPALNLLPDSTRVAFVGARRDEATLEPSFYLDAVPADLSGDDVVILDVMIATGGSLAATIEVVRTRNPRSLHVAGIIAAPEGLAHIAGLFPDVLVTVAVVDDHLNASGFIVPGLGDAGDRLYGT